MAAVVFSADCKNGAFAYEARLPRCVEELFDVCFEEVAVDPEGYVWVAQSGGEQDDSSDEDWLLRFPPRAMETQHAPFVRPP